MLKELQFTTEEFEKMKEINICYIDIENKEDFEE